MLKSLFAVFAVGAFIDQIAYYPGYGGDAKHDQKHC